MATGPAHYFPLPRRRVDYAGRPDDDRHAAPSRISYSAGDPGRRSRVGTVLVALVGATLGFSVVMFAANTANEVTLNPTEALPMKAPVFTSNPGYDQAILIEAQNAARGSSAPVMSEPEPAPETQKPTDSSAPSLWIDSARPASEVPEGDLEAPIPKEPREQSDVPMGVSPPHDVEAPLQTPRDDPD